MRMPVDTRFAATVSHGGATYHFLFRPTDSAQQEAPAAWNPEDYANDALMPKRTKHDRAAS